MKKFLEAALNEVRNFTSEKSIGNMRQSLKFLNEFIQSELLIDKNENLVINDYDYLESGEENNNACDMFILRTENVTRKLKIIQIVFETIHSQEGPH